jgi:hypothetical protein
MHPGVLVTALDRMAASYLPHYEEAGLEGVAYAQLDVR